MTITFTVSGDVKARSFEGVAFDHKDLYCSRADRAKQADRTIVKTSVEKGSQSVGCNSFVYSAFLAYSNHHELLIRPDDVWMAILVQFSAYVNSNAEQLRSKLVDFQGKKQLVVYGNGTLMNAPYEEMTIKMTHEIEKNINDPSIREWVNAPFSTTKPNDTIAASIALMATMKNYFEFKMSLMCGLPSVTLEGTLDDWMNIKKRIEKLQEFDFKDNGDQMKKWYAMLSPIIDQFISSANGSPNADWWNRIANMTSGGSGPTYLSGWITAFCVFDNDGKWVGDNKTRYSMMGRGQPETTEWVFVDSNEIPKGFLFAPVLIDDNGTQYNTEFYAGHFAASTEKNDKLIKPNIDWCILLN